MRISNAKSSMRAAISLGVGVFVSFFLLVIDMCGFQGWLLQLLAAPGNSVVRAVFGGYHSIESILLGFGVDSLVYGLLWFMGWLLLGQENQE